MPDTGLVLGALAFSAIGVLMAAPPTNAPSQIMMLSSLVRLPLIFISGVFVPHAEMPPWGQWLSPLSPLSYSADLIRVGFGGDALLPGAARHRGAGRVRRAVPRRRPIHSPADPRQGSIKPAQQKSLRA